MEYRFRVDKLSSLKGDIFSSWIQIKCIAIVLAYDEFATMQQYTLEDIVNSRSQLRTGSIAKQINWKSCAFQMFCKSN